PSFQQDLNGDGHIGLNPGSMVTASNVTASPITIDAGATLELNGPYTGHGDVCRRDRQAQDRCVGGFLPNDCRPARQPGRDRSARYRRRSDCDRGISRQHLAGSAHGERRPPHRQYRAPYMASSFVASSDGHGGTLITGASVLTEQLGNQTPTLTSSQTGH